MVIYKTTNLINGKIYVGKDSNDNPNYLGSGIVLKNAIDKYGRKSFKKEILEICDLSNINDREIYWIAKLNARNKKIGYNITVGGDGFGTGKDNPMYGKTGQKHPNYGKITSEETKRKISEANSGKQTSKETRLRMSESHKGKSISSKHKGIISDYMKAYWVVRENRHPSEATRNKMSESHTGKKNPMYGTHRCGEDNPMYGRHHSDEAKKKMSEQGMYRVGKNNPMYGRHHSKESKKKMSETRKNKNV